VSKVRSIEEVLSVIAALAALSCGCNESTCGNVEQARVVLDVELAQLAAMTLRGCRNERCFEVPLESLAGIELDADHHLLPVPSPLEGNGLGPHAWVYREDGRIVIDIQWHPNEKPQPGDLLSATLTTAEGDAWFSGEGRIVDVADGHQNDCGTRTCYSATTTMQGP
jgi:hypothetical protein